MLDEVVYAKNKEEDEDWVKECLRIGVAAYNPETIMPLLLTYLLPASLFYIRDGSLCLHGQQLVIIVIALGSLIHFLLTRIRRCVFLNNCDCFR